jgi:hypothetical protein
MGIADHINGIGVGPAWWKRFVQHRHGRVGKGSQPALCPAEGIDGKNAATPAIGHDREAFASDSTGAT